MVGQWYCVHIKKSRVFEATTRTFESLLKGEPRHPEIDCPVYGKPANDGDGYCYLFSPQASIQYRIFLKFWGGFESEEPKHLKMMKRVL